MEEQIGVIIEQGPADWQIVQQDERGEGRIVLGGKWKFETPGQVEVRLVWEDTGVAARRREDRVELEFAAVESRMDSIDLEANSFQVEDETGEVPIAAVSYPQDHRVELVLERPLQGAAKGHGGYGKDPAAVPADMERFLPMLGFWGVEIV